MRHSVYGRKLKRTMNERRRLFAGMIRDVILRDKITTSVAKAKAVQPLLEQLITKAKEGTETSKRGILQVVTDKKIVGQLLEYAKTRFATRSSGFTRIIKLGARRGDATGTAILSFVDEKVVVEQIAPKKELKAAPAKVEKKQIKEETKKEPSKKTAKKTVKKE